MVNSIIVLIAICAQETILLNMVHRLKRLKLIVIWQKQDLDCRKSYSMVTILYKARI